MKKILILAVIALALIHILQGCAVSKPKRLPCSTWTGDGGKYFYTGQKVEKGQWKKQQVMYYYKTK